jgi:Fe-S cluster assembly protein SufD
MTARELFVQELATRAQTLAVQAPALALLRKSAQLEELPAGKLESFKYTPIESLYDAALADPEPPTVGADVPEVPLVADGNSFELPVSGIDIDADALPPGLSAHSLAEAVLDQEGLDLQRLNAGLDVVRYPLVHLNTSLIQDGLVVRIAAGRRVTSTLELDLASTETATCSRVVIILEPGSELRLLEQHHQSVVANRVLEIRLGANSTLHHTRWQGRSDCAAWQLTSVVLEDDARYRLDAFTLGGAPHRNDFHVRLVGDRTDFTLTGVQLSRDTDKLDQQVVVEHLGQHGSSRQRIHGIASGKSRLSFNGRIHIHPGAQHTDARLTNRNLQLDSTAQVNTKPELEIYADDVQCAHGATVGQLDLDQLFYLRSRGISEASARALLLQGFLADALPEGTLGEQIGRLLEATLGGAGA